MVAVNPEILIWARETAALSIDEAARKLGFRDTKMRTATEKLRLLEAGEIEPSTPQLTRMAKAYYQPPLVFYLNQPPAEFDRGEDFRTSPRMTVDAKGEAHLKLLMRNVRVAQNLIRDAMEEEQVESLEFVNSASLSMGVNAVANEIREALAFNIETFRKAQSYQQAFAYLRERMENRRIFLLLLSDLGSHHTTISINVFRGFVYSDDLVPFIVINRKDAISAWSFTALHEVAHLWLGSSGVSGYWSNRRIEAFCCEVAGKILFPTHEIQAIEFDPNNHFLNLTDQIGKIAHSKKLSRATVAYSLLQAQKIDVQLWRKLNSRFEHDRLSVSENARHVQHAKGGGPSYYALRRHQLGKALLEVTKQFLDSGHLTPTKAALILGVAPTRVHALLNPDQV